MLVAQEFGHVYWQTLLSWFPYSSNWGTESDPEFKGYHNGNSEPRGYGTHFPLSIRLILALIWNIYYLRFSQVPFLLSTFTKLFFSFIIYLLYRTYWDNCRWHLQSMWEVWEIGSRICQEAWWRLVALNKKPSMFFFGVVQECYSHSRHTVLYIFFCLRTLMHLVSLLIRISNVLREF